MKSTNNEFDGNMGDCRLISILHIENEGQRRIKLAETQKSVSYI